MPHYRGPKDGPRVVTDKNLGKNYMKYAKGKTYPAHGKRAAEKAKRRAEKEAVRKLS